MRTMRTAFPVGLILLALLVTPLTAWSLDKDLAKFAIKEFNLEKHTVRPDHLLVSSNTIEVDDAQYVYVLSRRFARMARAGETFRIDKFKTRKRHLELTLKNPSNTKIVLRLYAEEELDQAALDVALPHMLRELFDFGTPPVRPHLIGHRRSHLYHLGTCNHLPVPDDREAFSDEGAARTAGYRPCGVCFSEETIVPIDGFGTARMAAYERARVFEIANPPVDDPAIQARVNSLGEQILAGFPLDLVGYEYRFKVCHSVIPQAMVLPTGFVFITDALLDIIEDEQELAFVLAHEIAHCELHLPPAGMSFPGRDPALIFTYADLYRWGRHQEIMADAFAVNYLHQSAGDEAVVQRARTILAKLHYAHEAVPTYEAGDFDTHPSFWERLRLFTDGAFASARGTPTVAVKPVDRQSVFTTRILGKSRDDDNTWVYVHVRGTDHVNEPWTIPTLKAPFNIRDGAGRTYTLENRDFFYEIKAGRSAVLRLRAGSPDVFDKIDLASDQARVIGSSARSDRTSYSEF